MEPGGFYHIFNRGNNRENIFFERNDYNYFLSRYKHYLSELVDTYAYCLMPNHFHFLIQVKENISSEGLLTKSFKDFFISYAKSINKKYNRTGSLFQSKFRKKLIDKDEYLIWLIFYIHHNPIEAGICNSMDEWEFSSYKSILSDKSTTLLRDEVLKWFDGSKEFIRFHKQNLNEDIIEKVIFDD